MRKLSALAALLLLFALCLGAAAETSPEREALEAFMLACFGSEYGPDHELTRWEQPIRLSLEGSPTPEDRAFAQAFIDQLNDRVAGFPGISLVGALGRPNVRVSYAPLDSLHRYVEGYVSGNWGYFSYWYEDYRMTKAQIGLASDAANQQQRNHLFMEELVGALGLAKDIDSHPESIVYQPWTETQQLADIDWLMLNYLYHPRLSPGMSADEAHDLLTGLLEDKP